jgi:hypothetical protein
MGTIDDTWYCMYNVGLYSTVCTFINHSRTVAVEGPLRAGSAARDCPCEAREHK